MNKDKITELNDEELENISGGNLKYAANMELLKNLGLNDIIDPCFSFFANDDYYDTKRNDGTWKKVGSDDMLAYVGSVVGFNDERYLALSAYCNEGKCNYKGQTYDFFHKGSKY